MEDMVKVVSNTTPTIGSTNKMPPIGGELVVMVTVLEEEAPLSRTQDKVKANDDCGGRLFPTITKLTKCEEPIEEAVRVRERGDNETDDNITETSFTDHFTTPPDLIFTLPNIFNFVDGFILNPEITSKPNTGDKESKIDNSITFWQVLTVPIVVGVDAAFPFIRILNTDGTGGGNDALMVTWITEEVEVREVKMRESHLATEGLSAKQLDSKLREEEDLVSIFES
jgi:hypothetical protein